MKIFDLYCISIFPLSHEFRICMCLYNCIKRNGDPDRENDFVNLMKLSYENPSYISLKSMLKFPLIIHEYVNLCNSQLSETENVTQFMNVE